MEEYRAHPAIGLRDSGWSPASWFGVERAPFWWLRLDAATQRAAEERFVREILWQLAVGHGGPIEVLADYDAEGAAAQVVAAVPGLRGDGGEVAGTIERSAIAAFAERVPTSLEVWGGEEPLLELHPDQMGVKVWLAGSDVQILRGKLAPYTFDEDTVPRGHGDRTRIAALLVVTDYAFMGLTLVAVVWALDLLDRHLAAALAFLIVVVGVVPVVLVVGELTGRIRKRLYEGG